MPFTLEKEMVPVFKSNLSSFIEKIDFSCKESVILYADELSVNYRMIDFALSNMDKTYFNSIKKYYRNRFNSINSILMDYLSVFFLKKNVTIHYFKKIFCLGVDKIKNHLNILINLGFINRISKYTYSVLDWVELLPDEIIAIEFKLKRWNKALEQGIYNLSFADYSFVVLDEHEIPQKNIAKEFEKNNVGLFYANNQGEMKIIYKPKPNNKKNEILWGFQKIKFLKDLSNNHKWKEAKMGG